MVLVNVKKLAGFIAIIFLLFWIISKPDSAGSSVNSMMQHLHDAGDSMTQFMSGMF
jgi:hypothetical protein